MDEEQGSFPSHKALKSSLMTMDPRYCKRRTLVEKLEDMQSTFHQRRHHRALSSRSWGYPCTILAIVVCKIWQARAKQLLSFISDISQCFLLPYWYTSADLCNSKLLTRSHVLAGCCRL